MTKMTPATAREYFWALLDNATSLIEDAALLEPRSPARAQSLLILAHEELGKADWVHTAFWRAWESGATAPLTVEPLATSARHHGAKYLAGRDASGYGGYLPIWVTWEELEPVELSEGELRGGMTDVRVETPAILDKISTSANSAKQRGFYVDVAKDGSILTPADVEMFDLRDHRGHIAAGIVTLICADGLIVGGRPEGSARAQLLEQRAGAHARDEDYLQ